MQRSCSQNLNSRFIFQSPNVVCIIQLFVVGRSSKQESYIYIKNKRCSPHTWSNFFRRFVGYTIDAQPLLQSYSCFFASCQARGWAWCLRWRTRRRFRTIRPPARLTKLLTTKVVKCGLGINIWAIRWRKQFWGWARLQSLGFSP
jgi:hypothetical protein